ncbi:MAG: hypothetical protein PHW31_04715 [Candidatus Pacebacteria bacterium]|nr:hypothetical protein [Candidatus Paceibacterota bacterium]
MNYIQKFAVGAVCGTIYFLTSYLYIEVRGLIIVAWLIAFFAGLYCIEDEIKGGHFGEFKNTRPGGGGTPYREWIECKRIPFFFGILAVTSPAYIGWLVIKIITR